MELITLQSSRIIAEYIESRAKQNPDWANLSWLSNPLLCHLSKNRQNFYQIDEFDDRDSVLSFYRHVQYMTTNYWRMTDWPISKNNNTEHEKIVFESALNGTIKHATIPDYTVKYVKDFVEPSIEPSDFNFFSKTSDELDNKWQTKHRVKLVLDNSKFVFKKVDTVDKPCILTLYDKWSSHKLEKDDLHNKISFKEYFKQFNTICYTPGIYQYVLKHEDTALGLVVFHQVACRYVYKVIQWSLIPDDVNEELVKKVVSQIGQILHFLYSRELKGIVEYIACTGSASHRDGLISHKDEVMRHKITYYTVIKKGEVNNGNTKSTII